MKDSEKQQLACKREQISSQAVLVVLLFHAAESCNSGRSSQEGRLLRVPGLHSQIAVLSVYTYRKRAFSSLSRQDLWGTYRMVASKSGNIACKPATSGATGSVGAGRCGNEGVGTSCDCSFLSWTAGAGSFGTGSRDNAGSDKSYGSKTFAAIGVSSSSAALFVEETAGPIGSETPSAVGVVVLPSLALSDAPSILNGLSWVYGCEVVVVEKALSLTIDNFPVFPLHLITSPGAIDLLRDKFAHNGILFSESRDY